MIANVVYSRRRAQLRVFIYRILVLERGISPCICLMRVHGTECWRLNLVSWTVIPPLLLAALQALPQLVGSQYRWTVVAVEVVVLTVVAEPVHAVTV